MSWTTFEVSRSDGFIRFALEEAFASMSYLSLYAQGGREASRSDGFDGTS
jgi:hypothetical protein